MWYIRLAWLSSTVPRMYLSGSRLSTVRTGLLVLCAITLPFAIFFIREKVLADYRTVQHRAAQGVTENGEHMTTSTHSEMMRLYNMTKIQEERKRKLSTVCGEVDPYEYLRVRQTHNMKRNVFLDRHDDLLYCKIEKAGSTFITAILKLLHLTQATTSQRNTSSKIITSAEPLGRISELENVGFDELHKAIMGSFRFLFVREPYGRLLSGYVDKFFMPNTLFWKTIGKRALSIIRGADVQCGYDMSFPEFIKYVIFAERTGEHTDTHFTTMSTHCEPCKLSYDFIGKMETFEGDFMTLLTTWNKLYGANITFNHFDSETAHSRAITYTKRLYRMKKGIEKCVPFYVGMKNTWIGLQIQGIIPKFEIFPFSESETAGVTRDMFQEAIHHVLERITDKAALKRQRQEALIEAYSLVPTELLVNLREIIRLDCVLFDYSDSPDFVFNTGQKNLHYFKH